MKSDKLFSDVGVLSDYNYNKNLLYLYRIMLKLLYSIL